MSNNETLDDILDEIRSDEAAKVMATGLLWRDMSFQFNSWADRIKAAVQRLVRAERTEAIDEALAHAEEVRAEKCRNCERARLRDIVRRLCDELDSHYHEPALMDDPCIVREAREALEDEQ